MDKTFFSLEYFARRRNIEEEKEKIVLRDVFCLHAVLHKLEFRRLVKIKIYPS